MKFTTTLACGVLALLAGPPASQAEDFQHLIFVSSGRYSVSSSDSVPASSGTFGGADAADWQCTSAAASAGLITGWDGLEIIYTAVLSDNSTTVLDRLDIQGPIYNINGDFIAADEADLFSGSIANPVSYTELGTLPNNPIVWTGITQAGTNVNNCGDWLNTNLQGNAAFGNVSTAQWLSVGPVNCTATAQIY